MRSLAIIAFSMALTFQVASGQTPAPLRRIAYTLPGMDRVQVSKDRVYRSIVGSPDTAMYGPTLRYDVYLPSSAGPARPAIVFIHGGMVAGSQRVSPKDDLPSYQEWGRLVAAAGFLGITFSHRLTTQDNADVAATDVTALLAEVRSKATEWNLDANRLCVAVFSAGGPLSSLFLGGEVPSVRCVALYYPFLDLEHTTVHTPFRPAHPQQRIHELARFSPRAKLLEARNITPILLARAGRDAIPGINASIDRFMQAALWVNAPVDFYLHPTGNHGFDLASAPDARAGAIVEATIAFFRRHLNNAPH